MPAMPTAKRVARKPSKVPRKRPGPTGGKRDTNRRATRERLLEAGARADARRRHRGGDDRSDRHARRHGEGQLLSLRRRQGGARRADHGAGDDRGHGGARSVRAALRTARRRTTSRRSTSGSRSICRRSWPATRRACCSICRSRAHPARTRGAIHALVDQLTARTIALTEIARDHGLIRAIDPGISALTVLGGVDAILFAHLRKRRAPRAAIPQVTAELVDIVLRGIKG